ncbi:MAG: hypothetical protein KDH88_15295, partial [Chromatiales bacterium]|nr:hypothetical protein [Chromatiales bacterium]
GGGGGGAAAAAAPNRRDIAPHRRWDAYLAVQQAARVAIGRLAPSLFRLKDQPKTKALPPDKPWYFDAPVGQPGPEGATLVEASGFVQGEFASMRGDVKKFFQDARMDLEDGGEDR